MTEPQIREILARSMARSLEVEGANYERAKQIILGQLKPKQA